MTTMFASLNHRAYRLWFAGALVANVGTWMQRIAQDWLVYTDLSAESGIAIGTVTALQFLPALLLGPYAGLLADRLPRRGLLMLTQALMGLLALGLGLLVLLGEATLWHVWLFALGLGVVSALDNPVRQTFVAELVPNETLPNAVALNSASFNAARLIGPAVSGLAIAAFGAGWVFVINAVSFVFTIIALLAMRTSDLVPVPHAERAKGQLREGFAYLRRRSDLMLILVVIGVASAFGLNFQMTSAMMARSEFGQGAADYGILGSIMAIGSLAGALLTARLGKPRVRRILVASLLFGVTSCLMAMAPTYWTYAVATIPVGFFTLTMLTSANTYMQTSTAPEMRGRVMAFYLMVLLGSTPIGSPVVGWIGETLGPRWSIGAGGIATVVIAAVGMAWARRRWDVELHYVPGAARRTQRFQVTSAADRARVDEAAQEVA
ncbi:MFS transporter [Salana multivorans]|nr:MFS transporter [Salana multivorans]MBN8883680.1 MFS transporter [Salana multivorans]OJX93899.1 MAG: MFS transporter [Micrococcales bacterium 73-15]